MNRYDNYEQVQLYKFTLLLYDQYSKLIPEGCDSRCIYSTIINRAYYSTYLCSLLWLEDERGFKLRPLSDFKDEKIQTEHEQVIRELRNQKKHTESNELRDLKRLRKKADYKPFEPLTLDEVKDSINLMKDIIENTLLNN